MEDRPLDYNQILEEQKTSKAEPGGKRQTG